MRNFYLALAAVFFFGQCAFKFRKEPKNEKE